MPVADSFYLPSTNVTAPEGTGMGHSAVILAWKSSTVLPASFVLKSTTVDAYGNEYPASGISLSTQNQGLGTNGVWGFAYLPFGNAAGTRSLKKISFEDNYNYQEVVMTNLFGMFLPTHYSQGWYGSHSISPQETGVGDFSTIPASGISPIGGDLYVTVAHAQNMRNRTTRANFTPAHPDALYARHEYIAPTTSSTTGWSLMISAQPYEADGATQTSTTWTTTNPYSRSVGHGTTIIPRSPRLYKHTEMITYGRTRSLNLLGEWDGTDIQPVTPEIT